MSRRDTLAAALRPSARAARLEQAPKHLDPADYPDTPSGEAAYRQALAAAGATFKAAHLYGEKRDARYVPRVYRVRPPRREAAA